MATHKFPHSIHMKSEKKTVAHVFFTESHEMHVQLRNSNMATCWCIVVFVVNCGEIDESESDDDQVDKDNELIDDGVPMMKEDVEETVDKAEEE